MFHVQGDWVGGNPPNVLQQTQIAIPLDGGQSGNAMLSFAAKVQITQTHLQWRDGKEAEPKQRKIHLTRLRGISQCCHHPNLFFSPTTAEAEEVSVYSSLERFDPPILDKFELTTVAKADDRSEKKCRTRQRIWIGPKGPKIFVAFMTNLIM